MIKTINTIVFIIVFFSGLLLYLLQLLLLSIPFVALFFHLLE